MLVCMIGEDFLVIPGTRQTDRLRENLLAGKALQHFTDEDDAEVRKLVKEIQVVGDRYDKDALSRVNR